MDNLNSILNEQAETQEETQVESQVEEHTEGQEATGETTTPPVVEQEEEDEGTKRIKGLEAAAAAERRRRQQAEQERQQLAEELERLRRGQPQQQTKPQADGLARPKRDEFASQEEYEDALLEYGDKRREIRAQQELAQRQQEQYIAARQAALTEVVKRGQSKYRDFDPVIDAGLGPVLTHELQNAILALDQPEDVAYWLAKNPSEAQKVASMPPAKMLKALGAIEATKLGAEEQRQSIPQTLTQARNASGQFEKAYSGPTPLNDILGRKT